MPKMAQFRQYFSKLYRLSPLGSWVRFSSASNPKAKIFPRAFGSQSGRSKSGVDRTFGAILVAGLGVGFAASAPSLSDSSENTTETGRSEPKAGILEGPVVTRSGTVLPKLKIFVGYDSREDIAYEVCRHSILKHATFPVEVVPIKQADLRNAGLYWRPRGSTESTEFSFTRFLTPFLAGFEGWAMFVDCDFLYTADLRELAELIDDKYAIMCVKHDYTPKQATKMDGVVQTAYPRKNWSSMVLYNCSHPKNRVLTPSVVNSQSGAFLHRFMWLDDSEIGSIPLTWNFLVGHNKMEEVGASEGPPKAIHYTLGGPWFEAWKDCEFGDLWLREMEEHKRARMIQRVVQEELARLLDRRMDERAGELEARIAGLEGRVKEMSIMQKLLLFNLQEKLLNDAGNGGKEHPVDA